MKNHLVKISILFLLCFNAYAKQVEDLTVFPFKSLRFSFDDVNWSYAITNNPYPSYSIRFGSEEVSLTARELVTPSDESGKKSISADSLVEKLISKPSKDPSFTVTAISDANKLKAPELWSCRTISVQRKSDGNKMSIMACVYYAGDYYEELLIFVADEATERSIEELNRVISTIKHV
jgi:hypothetical protein